MNTPTLGQRLRAWRIKHDLTLADVAKRLNIRRFVLEAIEDGVQAAPSTATAIEALIGPDWQATASKLDEENARLAALVQSLQVQLEDERRLSAWFEEAAHQLQAELSELRAIATYARNSIADGISRDVRYEWFKALRAALAAVVAHYDH